MPRVVGWGRGMAQTSNGPTTDLDPYCPKRHSPNNKVFDPLISAGTIFRGHQHDFMNAIFPQTGAPNGASTGERLLADAIRRARSANQQLLILHLGTLALPRPHHRRIARALLQDAASRHDGQVFSLRNGDLALLTPITECPGTDDLGHATDPARLADTFAELFKADRPDLSGMLSVWNIEYDQARIFEYLQALMTRTPAPQLDDEVAPPPANVEDIASLLAAARIGDLTRRQTAIEIVPSRGGGGKIMRPLFREITFSVEVLESRLAVTGRASNDPYLFRHLAGRLDPRMIEHVLDDLGHQSPGAPRLHLNLTMDTILSDEFDQFAGHCLALGQRPGIEVPLIEALRAPEQFAAMRARVQSRGFPLVIEGMSALALRLANPACFGADLVKLDWHNSIAPHPHPDLLVAIKRLGAERIVLQHVEGEPAVAFGLAQGITRFQGRYIDTLLAAARLKSCPHAGGCTLHQCTERGSAVSAATRRFCLNLDLLDRGMPEIMRRDTGG